jgi:phage shock protein PspC (stress-responsive transcriptional regulator)
VQALAHLILVILTIKLLPCFILSSLYSSFLTQIIIYITVAAIMTDTEKAQKGRGFEDAMDTEERQHGDYESLPQESGGPGPARCKKENIH